MGFQQYKTRGQLFPEKDQTRFYEPNKEVTMRGLRSHAVNWSKVSQRRSASVMASYCGVEAFDSKPDSCDYNKAILYQSQMIGKPKKTALLDFSKTTARGSTPMITNDSYANVLLENTREERIEQI